MQLPLVMEQLSLPEEMEEMEFSELIVAVVVAEPVRQVQVVMPQV